MQSIGQFKVLGDKLVVSDPCYVRGTWCQGIVENALSGAWNASIVTSDDTQGWGRRVFELHVSHEKQSARGTWTTESFEVGVDSGQAGVFDESLYPTETDKHSDRDNSEFSYDRRGSFYNRACEATTGRNPCDHEREDGRTLAGVMKEGAVSSSGYGDGSYTCLTHRNPTGKVDAVKIVFVSDEDEDEEDEDQE